jgi:glycosyltransferase involved in cell wall biosynthesis
LPSGRSERVFNDLQLSRIAYIFFQTPDRANGGVNSLVEIIEGFADYRPLVITQVETPVNDRLRALGIEVRVAPEGTTGSGVLPKWKFSRWLAKELKEQPIRLVHTNDIAALLHALPFLILRRLPVLHNVRSMYAEGRKYGLHWTALGWCKRVVALSKEMENGLRHRLPIPRHLHRLNRVFRFAPRSDARFTHVYSIVDFSRFYPVADAQKRLALREQLGLPTEEVLVAYVAKFAPVKQQLDYLEQLSRTSVSFRTVFVGDYAPESNPYAAQCQALPGEIAGKSLLRSWIHPTSGRLLQGGRHCGRANPAGRHGALYDRGYVFGATGCKF